jgi:hypothetical protein
VAEHQAKLTIFSSCSCGPWAAKVSDEWAIPLCVTHHRVLHDVGSEEAWWAERGVDAKAEA